MVIYAKQVVPDSEFIVSLLINGCNFFEGRSILAVTIFDTLYGWFRQLLFVRQICSQYANGKKRIW